MREIRPAGADVGAEHVGAVAFVVHTAGEGRVAVAELCRIAEAIDGRAADRRQEGFQVGARHQLRIHAAGVLVQARAQLGLADAEAPRDAGQVPDRIDRGLHHAHDAVRQNDVTVGADAAGIEGGADLRHVDMGARHRDGRADVDAARELVAKDFADAMAPRIERNDLVRVGPLRMRADEVGRRSVGEVGAVVGGERAGRDGERAVNRVAAGVAADGAARRVHGPDHGAALRRGRGAPAQRGRGFAAGHQPGRIE